jgi:hypothetical protein
MQMANGGWRMAKVLATNTEFLSAYLRQRRDAVVDFLV